MPAIESLHNHTTLSDGKLSHRELFNLACELDMSVIAFTDHDSVPSPETIAELETLRDRTTKWIIGTELTSGLPHELASKQASLHIIGLFVDPANPALLEHCRRAQESRIVRMKKIVTALQGLGFTITEEDCLAASGGESVGRPHIVEALKQYPENMEVMERARLEMEAEAKNNPRIKRQYDHMMQKGERSYPYGLFLSPEAFKPAYFDHDYMPDLDQTVALIRGAGGIAFIAHYYAIHAKMPFEILEKLLAERRIDGVEVVYGMREYGTERELAIREERAIVRELAEKHGALIAGGSDAHSEADQRFYAENRWFSNDSAGLATRILSSGRVDKRFSSL